MYLDVGKFLYNLQKKSKYGDKVTTKAAAFMKKIILILKDLLKEI